MNDDARQQVREFLKVMEEDHGITLYDIKNALRYYRSVSKWSDYLAKTVIGGLAGSIVAGIGYLLWTGVTTIIHQFIHK